MTLGVEDIRVRCRQFARPPPGVLPVIAALHTTPVRGPSSAAASTEAGDVGLFRRRCLHGAARRFPRRGFGPVGRGPPT